MDFVKTISILLATSSIIANTYIVNKEHSAIKFGVSYFKVSTVEGHFQDYLIIYETDEEIKNILSFKGQIFTSSVNTLDKKRDSHLKKSDFFDAKKFPLISFESTSLIPLFLNKKQKIPVSLTIKDIKKDLMVEFIYLGKRIDPWTKAVGEYFEIRANIKRSLFGITWNKLIDGTSDFLVGDEVNINISIESYHANEKPAFSRFYKEKENYATHSTTIEDNQTSYKNWPSISGDKVSNESRKAGNSDLQSILATIFTSFLIFIPLIFASIFFQKKMSQFLEDKGVSDSLSYIIPSSIIMIILIFIFYFTGPLMGIGRNPILDLFN